MVWLRGGGGFRFLREAHIRFFLFTATVRKMQTAIMRVLFALFLSVCCALNVAAQTAASPTLATAPITNSTTRAATQTTSTATSSAPDVYLNVPTLSVGRIELIVEDLSGTPDWYASRRSEADKEQRTST